MGAPVMGRMWAFTVTVCVLVCYFVTAFTAGCNSDLHCPENMHLQEVMEETDQDIVQESVQDQSPEGKKPLKPLISTERQRGCCGCHNHLTTIVKITAPTYAKRVPGYESYMGLGYYKFYSEARTWFQAERQCRKDGAHLIVLNTATEAGVVRQLYHMNPNVVGAMYPDWMHAGHNDLEEEGVYYAVTGELIRNLYNKWHQGEPNDNGVRNEDCGVVHKDGDLGDSPCSFRYPFICEQE